jgi:hypothetical protein
VPTQAPTIIFKKENNMALQQFSSLAGADIKAVFGNYEFANLHMIKYGISREKAKIYTLGSPSPRATARGKRTVGGALVFSHLDTDGLVRSMTKQGSDANSNVFLSNSELINSGYGTVDGKSKTTDEARSKALRQGGTIVSNGLLGTATAFDPFAADTKSVFNANNFGQTIAPYLADQLLPFDITIVGTSEYSSDLSQRLIIKNVEITSEASGTSIDDLAIEKQMAFIADTVIDWKRLSELQA